jgi:hypothetical protein
VREYSETEIAYLQSGKPFGCWMFLRFVVKDSEGAPAYFNFSEQPDDETVTVINPNDGSDASRNYLGGPHVVDVEDITLTAGNQIVTTAVKLAMTDEVVDMVENHVWSRGRAEIHEGLIDADTMLLVDKPGCVWLGIIDRIEPRREAQDDEDDGDVEPGQAQEYYLVTIANHLREMDRGNSKLRSKSTGLERDDDEILSDLREAGKWKLRWGMEEKSEEERGGGKGGGKDGGGGGPGGFNFGRES